MTEISLLCKATIRAVAARISKAEPHELRPLTRRVATDLSLDVLGHWIIISIQKDDVCSPKLHALGWRVGLANTWVTTPLVAVDFERHAVLTSSGKVYALGEGNGTDLHPLLPDHLAYALETWGLDNIRWRDPVDRTGGQDGADLADGPA